MFFCEFCEISKNTFLTEHLWWLLLKKDCGKEKTIRTPFSQNTSWQLLLFLQEFIFNQTYTAWISFWFLEKQGSTNDSIHRLLLLSRKSLDRIDKIAFKTFVSSSVHVSRKDIFHSAPYTKLLLVHTSQ